MDLKNKRILITAGPTWVPIDSVRVISNIATGQTGVLLAEELNKRGAKVTLVLGPTAACCINKRIRVINFHFFEELKSIILKELKKSKYDILIHSAAVSDYRPLRKYAKKVRAGMKSWSLSLVPTVKIIDSIKKINPQIKLVGFKFEPEVSKHQLLNCAKRLAQRVRADLVVANTLLFHKYQAYLLNGKSIYGPLSNRQALVKKLAKATGEILCRN